MPVYNNGDVTALFFTSPFAVRTGHQTFITVLAGRCCSTDCLARVTRADAAAARIAFKEKSLGDQRTWLMEYFRTHSSRSENESLQFSYNIGLEQVCATAWHQVVGIVRSRFYYWQKQFRGEVHISKQFL